MTQPTKLDPSRIALLGMVWGFVPLVFIVIGQLYVNWKILREVQDYRISAQIKHNEAARTSKEILDNQRKILARLQSANPQPEG
jgi:hypothetical protein